MLISRRSRDKILTLCLDRLPVSPGVLLSQVEHLRKPGSLMITCPTLQQK